MIYKLRPVEIKIHAEQFRGHNHIGEFRTYFVADHWTLWVEKSQTWCQIDVGDYIVKEPDGVGYYPCKKDIFEDKYEELNG